MNPRMARLSRSPGFEVELSTDAMYVARPRLERHHYRLPVSMVRAMRRGSTMLGGLLGGA